MAVWCAVAHLLTAALLLETGPPPLEIAAAGSWMALGCAGLALLHRVFLYPPLPLLLMASIGLALQRAPGPEPVRLLEPRPVRLQARLREWHSGEEQAWALFDHLQRMDNTPLAVVEERLLGLCLPTSRAPRPGQALLLEGLLTHDGRSFRLESFRWTVKHDDRAPPLLHVRNQVRERLHSRLSPTEAGLAVALLLGERRDLTPWQEETYRRFGLVHLLAVSGMHFWLWDALLRRILRGPLAYGRIPLLACAAALAGGSAPVMRAFSVVVLRDLMARHGLSVRGLHLWAAAWMLEIALHPPSALGLGFLLSYAATGCLILGAAPIHRPAWWKALQASWVAFLGSMPFLHQVQGTVEPWSILLSPILGLLLPLRLCAGLLALVPGFAPFADVFLRAITSVEEGCFQLLDGMPWSPYSNPEQASLWLYLVALAGILLVLPNTHAHSAKRWLAILVFLLGCWGPTPSQPGLLVLPVGHGLAVVVAGKEESLCFDLGSGERTPRALVERILYPGLRRRHWPVPQRIIRSHGDRDHVNGFPFLQERVALHREQVDPGHSRELVGFAPWRVRLYGTEGADKGIANDRGHVLDLRWDSRRIVLLGDQAGFALEELVHRLPPGPIDVLLVPHHGLTTDGLAPLLRHLQPHLAWSSSGPRNFPLPVEPLLHHFDIPLMTTLHGPLSW